MALKKAGAVGVQKQKNGKPMQAIKNKGAANAKPRKMATRQAMKSKKVEVEQKFEPSDDESDDEANGIQFQDSEPSDAEDNAKEVGDEKEDVSDSDDADNSDDDEEPGELKLSPSKKAELKALREEASGDEEEDDGDVDDEAASYSDDKEGGNEEDEEDESNVEANSDDDGPVEEPIGAEDKSKKNSDILKVNIGYIPFDTPRDRIIFVNNLPKGSEHQDVLGVFSKFGSIEMIDNLKSTKKSLTTRIAFENTAAVESALAAPKKDLTLNGAVLQVRPAINNEDVEARTVAVGLIGPNMKKGQIEEHFTECGEIDTIKFTSNKVNPISFVRFKSADAVPLALKLNSSELDGRFITVRKLPSKIEKPLNMTLILDNNADFESYSSNKIESIFKNYDVEDIEIVCTKKHLAFIIFKSTADVQRAIDELNGKTVDGLEISLRKFGSNSSPRTILIHNLAENVTEDDLRLLFKNAGDITEIKLFKKPFSFMATIEFDTDSGFCNSFLMNEHNLHGQPIFLEPNSLLKKKILKERSKFQPIHVNTDRFHGSYRGSPGGGRGGFRGNPGGGGRGGGFRGNRGGGGFRGNRGGGGGNFRGGRDGVSNFNMKRPSQATGAAPHKRPRQN